MSTITIERKLEILGTKKIIVPGCEPTSAISSPTLMAQQRAQGLCINATVNLDDALAAIPGSYIQFGINYNQPAARWFVLPPFDPSVCPCEGVTDWYDVLRSIATNDEAIENAYDSCNILDQGYCPSPVFRDTPEPQASTYTPEGGSSLMDFYTP